MCLLILASGQKAGNRLLESASSNLSVAGSKIGLSGNQNEEIHFKIDNVPADSFLEITIEGGTGDVDLFVKQGSPPTTTDFDCRPYRNGNSERCFERTSMSATWHIMIFGYSDFSDVDLTWKYESIEMETGSEIGLSGNQNEEFHFEIDNVPADSSLEIQIEGGTGDVDLFVKQGSPPTTRDFDCRPYKQGNSERCYVERTSMSATWHIMILGYSDFSDVDLTWKYEAIEMEDEDQWGSWDEWSECDATCGDGSRTRMRTCNGNNCVGPNLESEDCNLPTCVTTDAPYWGSWSQWSDCSVDCGSGLQTRSRECIGSGCDGDSSETQQCTLEPCDDDDSATGECQYVPVDASECPDSIDSSNDLPDCRSDVDDGDLCEADYPIDGVQNHNVNNCPGGYDVFRYVCGGEVGEDSEFEDLGRGICRSSSGGVVAGWGGWPKSAGECRRMCESRDSCIGYTAVTTGGTGTCYVHGEFTESIPNGWFDANGKVDEIGTASGHHNLACYKRV